jgi:O-antigen/teichoic acid export membrane protein
MKGHHFLKHAAVYGVANLLPQAAGLALLFLYTRCLQPRDYGVLEVLGRLGETVATILVIGGVRQAMLTFYQQGESESERRQVVTAGLASVFACCLVGGALALALAGWITPFLHTRSGSLLDGNLVRLAILCIVVEPLIQVPLALMQARTQSGRYVLAQLGMVLLRVGLCVLLLAGLGWGVAGVLLATVCTTGLFGLALSVRELVRGVNWPGWGRLGALWRFALPFLPGGICFFVLHHGDRYLLLAWRGEAEVGTYALGYRLAMTVGMFSLTPLHLVWGPQVYRAAKEPDAPRLFGVVFTRVLAVYLLLGLGLCLFRAEVVGVLGGAAYADAAGVIVPVVLACFCQAGATLMDSAFYIRRRTDLKLLVTLVATALMLGLYFLWIPAYGGRGAALATLGGFGGLAAGTFYLTQKIFFVRYEWARLLGLVLPAALLLGGCELMPAGPWALPVKAVAWLLYPVLLWKAGLISPREKRYARSFARQAWDGARQWLRPRLAPAGLACPPRR